MYGSYAHDLSHVMTRFNLIYFVFDMMFESDSTSSNLICKIAMLLGVSHNPGDIGSGLEQFVCELT